jgi:hypothetical protein
VVTAGATSACLTTTDLLLGRTTQSRHTKRLLRPRRRTSRLEAFQEHYSFAARPYNWKYTTKDLNDLLDRLATHDAAPLPATA